MVGFPLARKQLLVRAGPWVERRGGAGVDAGLPLLRSRTVKLALIAIFGNVQWMRFAGLEDLDGGRHGRLVEGLDAVSCFRAGARRLASVLEGAPVGLGLVLRFLWEVFLVGGCLELGGDSCLWLSWTSLLHIESVVGVPVDVLAELGATLSALGGDWVDRQVNIEVPSLLDFAMVSCIRDLLDALGGAIV